MKKTIISRISKYSPCSDAATWLGNQTNITEAWNACPRGDWMLWLAARVGVERPTLVKAAAACARLSFVYVKEGEIRPLKAIEAAEAWAENPTEENRKAADAAAYAAAYAAYDAAYAAYDAAYAAYAAANAAYAAAYAAAKLSEILKQCADIVRKHYPTAPDLERK